MLVYVCRFSSSFFYAPDAQGVLGWTDEELVSTDIVRNPNSGVVDARAGLQVAPTFMKIIVW